jgi:hypothetical protein
MHRYFLQNDQFFYLCTCKILFVAQINPPRGTIICRTNRGPGYTNRALFLSSSVISSTATYLPPLPLALSSSFLWLFIAAWTPLPLAVLSLPSISRLNFCRRPILANHSGSTGSLVSTMVRLLLAGHTERLGMESETGLSLKFGKRRILLATHLKVFRSWVRWIVESKLLVVISIT